MTAEAIQLIVLAVLSAAALAYWARFVRTWPQRVPPPDDYGPGDAILASVLGLWFVYVISQSFGRTFVITGQVIAENILVYTFLVIFLLGFLVGRGRNPLVLFGLRPRGLPAALGVAAAAFLAALPVVYLIHGLTQIALGGPDDQEVVTFLREQASAGDRVLVILMAVLVAPVAEETIFRGYFHGVVRQYGGVWCGIGVNSLLFAAVHGHLAALPGLFALAVALTLVYERTRTLWAPIAMHIVFNLLTVLFALFGPAAAP